MFVLQMTFLAHFHKGKGTEHWHAADISDNPCIYGCFEVSVPSYEWKEGISTDLRMLARPGRYLSEPYVLGIWDGNLLRIAGLTKFPISLVFGRTENSMEMAHVARLLCGAGQHQWGERPEEGMPNQRGCVFSRLCKGLGLAPTSREHLRFVFCASIFKCHSPDSGGFEHSRNQGRE